MKSSQISKFYQLNRLERLNLLKQHQFLTDKIYKYLEEVQLLDSDVAEHLIENQITQYPLPEGVALNFLIDGKDYVIPMVTEEPSVIAACSYGAKLARDLGGFQTVNQKRHMIGQLVFQEVVDWQTSLKAIEEQKEALIQYGNTCHPSIVKRGGGVIDLSAKLIENEQGDVEFLTVYVTIDVKEAMGANIINTILEGMSAKISSLVSGDNLLAILSNYSTESLVTVTTQIPFESLKTNDLSGQQVACRIEQATKYAHLDPYRAVTHNKGILNGVDGVVLATGNDWRAVEAGVHAYASRLGRYQSLTDWQGDETNQCLIGSLTLPLHLGTVGGAISVLPGAQANLALLGNPTGEKLASIVASVGLAQNLAALKALVSEGIQKGHMGLQARSLAISVGAKEEEIEAVAKELRQVKQMNVQAAEELLTKIRCDKK